MNKIKVLLVDDEWAVLRSQEKMLTFEGFQVKTAQNSQQALEVFKEARQAGEPFQVAVVDLHMPDFEGVEVPDAGFSVLRELLAIQPDLVVIVLTAYDSVSMVKTALKAGARNFFVKGRDEDLAAVLRDTLAQE